MLLTPLFAEARALWRTRGKSGRAGRAARKRPSARRATFERLEVREVLSGGIVVTSVGAATRDYAYATFLDSAERIVVAGATYSASSGFDSAVLRFQANGALDATFDNDGIVTTPISKYGDGARAAAMYPANSTNPEKILLGGYSYCSKQKPFNFPDYGFALARYNLDGSLDTAFGAQSSNVPGTVVTDLAVGGSQSSDIIAGVVVLPDGRIVAAGDSDASQSRLTFACYTPDGALDPTFGTAGVVKTSFPGIDLFETHGVTLHEGGILAVGIGYKNGWGSFALARLDLNGTLDPNFGNGGIVTSVCDSTIDNWAMACAVQPDGKIVVVGDAGHLVPGGETYDLAVARYTPAGTLDLAFGQNGFVLVDVHSRQLGALGRSVAIQSDGKIVVAVDGLWGFGVVRLNPDGSLDDGTANDTTSGDKFGADGSVFTPILSGATPASLAMQRDGRIAVTGTAIGADQRRFIAIARYMPNGSLDESFVGDTPSLAINDVSKSEGNGGWTTPTAFSFTVTRSGNLAGAASVNYATANGTATAASDYTATSGTLTFAPGETTKTITVLVNGDKLKEPNETFVVNLSNAVGATITDGTGIGTILNDDGKGSAGSVSAAALTDAALADTGRQQLALAALLQYEDQLQFNRPARSKNLEVPAIDLALAELALQY